MNFADDYSNIFNSECNFEFTDSDYYAFPEYPNDPDDSWPDIPLDQMQSIPNEAQRTFYHKNFMSLDQLTTIFSGLRCAYDLVGDELVQPTPNDPPLNLRLESKEIEHRILNYIVHEETCPGNDPCYSFQIKNIEGRTNIPGSDLSMAAPFVFSIGRHFNYPLFNNWVNDGLSNVRVALMMDSPDLMDIVDDLNWNGIIAMGELLPAQITQLFNIDPSDFDLPVSVNYPCIGNLIDRLEEKGNEPINIGTIPLSQLLILIDEFQEQNIGMISENSEICVSLTTELLQAIVDLEIDVQGFYCDNIGLGIAKVIAVIAASNLLEASSLLTSVAALSWIAEINEEPSFCIQTADNNSLSEDNVHMFQELATISERLSAEYIHSIAEPSGLDYYTMLRAVLDPSSNAINLLSFEHYKNDFINNAPCGGTWGKPETGGDFQNPTFFSGNDWASRNRLFHAQDRQFGANTPEFRGEYSGLDYMLYYNLHHLLWPNTLPSYQRNISCQCVEEITYYEELWEPINVNPKFVDYLAKGIPIESYLAHDLTLTSTQGIKEVKNDLIICSSAPNVSTTLTITAGAQLKLYGGNTITVRAGNKLVFEDGAYFMGGIAYELSPGIYSDPQATLIVEAGAEVHVLSGAIFEPYCGMTIRLANGAKFIVDDATVTMSFISNDNLWLLEDQGTELIVRNGANFVNWNQFNLTMTAENGAKIFVEDSYMNLPNSNGIHLGMYGEFHATNSDIHIPGSGLNGNGLSKVFITDSDIELDNGLIKMDGGSELFLDHATIDVGSEGEIKILRLDGPDLPGKIFTDNSEIYLEGAESKMIFQGGELYIPPGQTFQFHYTDLPHGYIEVLQGCDNLLHTGANSVLKLEGENSDDLVLKVHNGGVLSNANFGQGKISFLTCKVDLTSGTISTNLPVKTMETRFETSTFGLLEVWYGDFRCSYSEFQSMNVISNSCKYNMDHCIADDCDFHMVS